MGSRETTEDEEANEVRSRCQARTTMAEVPGKTPIATIRTHETDKGIKVTSIDKVTLLSSSICRVGIRTLSITRQTSTCLDSETIANNISASRGQTAATPKESSKTTSIHRVVAVASTWQVQCLSMHREVTRLLTLATTLT